MLKPAKTLLSSKIMNASQFNCNFNRDTLIIAHLFVSQNKLMKPLKLHFASKDTCTLILICLVIKKLHMFN